MKKLYLVIIIFSFSLLLIGCQSEKTVEEKEDIYQKLVMAETLSGMMDKVGTVIRIDGSLGLPTEYQGVTITYQSRVPEIISNTGVVTRPSTCWIQSRDQQGVNIFEGLNDNWPVVIDVTLSYEGQVRNAKLLFVVAPTEGFTCNTYKG